MIAAPRRRLAALVLASALLAGCSGGDHADLDSYVASVKARTSPPIEAMPQIATYTPYSYNADGRRDPFTPPAPERTTSASTVHPDLDRPLDPLEQYPLDALKLVGTITSSGVTYALIQAPDGVVHRAAPGTHLGRNYGEINHVDAAGIVLTEIVPDGNGGYQKRSAMLTPPTDQKP